MDGLAEPYQVASKRWPLETVAYVAIASILLSWVALYNGAPLVFSDTISYALAAYQGQVPGMFSVFYSIFILPFHWGVSFWPVVFVQGAIIAHLLYLTARVTSLGLSLTALLLVIVGLCIFSSLPWITSEIMPDVFTPVVLLGIFLLGCGSDRLSRGELLYVGVLTTFAISTHLSHVPIALGLILLCLGLRWLMFRDRVGSLTLRLAAPLAIALVFMLGVNWINSQQFVLSRNSNVFLLAKWIDEGPALAYLKRACPQSDYALCDHLAALEDATHAQLKWSPDSPFNEVGGFDALEPEARSIVRNTFYTYPHEILRNAVADSFRQLSEFDAGEGASALFARMVAENVSRIYGASVGEPFVLSKQGQGLLPIATFQALHLIGLAAGAALCVWSVLARRSTLTRELLALYAFIFSGMIWNALVTGALSDPYGRYLARVVWLVCFAGLLGLIASVSSRARAPAP